KAARAGSEPRRLAHFPRVEGGEMLDQIRLMRLLMIHEHGCHVGDADRSAGVAHHVVEARGVADALAADARKRSGGQRREDHAHPDSHDEAGPRHRPRADLSVPSRHRPQGDCHYDEPNADQWTRIVAVAPKLSDDQHRCHRAKSSWREHQTRLPRAVTHQLLQKNGIPRIERSRIGSVVRNSLIVSPTRQIVEKIVPQTTHGALNQSARWPRSSTSCPRPSPMTSRMMPA